RAVHLRDPEGNGRRHRRAPLLAQIAGQLLGDDQVGAQGTARAVLLRAADGNDHVGALFQVLLDVLPERQLEQHGGTLPQFHRAADSLRSTVSASVNQSLISGVAPTSVGSVSSFAPALSATSCDVFLL